MWNWDSNHVQILKITQKSVKNPGKRWFAVRKEWVKIEIYERCERAKFPPGISQPASASVCAASGCVTTQSWRRQFRGSRRGPGGGGGAWVSEWAFNNSVNTHTHTHTHTETRVLQVYRWHTSSIITLQTLQLVLTVLVDPERFCIHTHTHTNTHTHTHTHTHTLSCIHTHTHTHTLSCIHIHTQARSHTHTHTHTHTSTHMCWHTISGT